MGSRLEALLNFYEKDPNDAFTIYGIALEYISAGNPELGEKYLMELLEKEPGYVPGYMQYAQLKEKKNDIEGARELYKKGINAALKAGDKHALNEMEAFLDDLN